MVGIILAVMVEYVNIPIESILFPDEKIFGELKITRPLFSLKQNKFRLKNNLYIFIYTIGVGKY
jgi:hypothetical protein